MAEWDLEKSVEFGLENIKSLPDKRAINTLVTSLVRLNKIEEAISLLQSVRKDRRLKIKKNQIINLLKKEASIPKIEDCPFLFDLNEEQKLTKKYYLF